MVDVTTTPEEGSTMLTAGSTEALFVTNRLAARLFEAAVRNAVGPAGAPAANEKWAQYEAAAEDLHRSAVALIQVAPTGTEVVTVDGPLIIASKDDDRVTLTEDGGPALSEWHDGALDTDAAVRYERYTAEGRVSHGWIDRTTRKIVQTG